MKKSTVVLVLIFIFIDIIAAQENLTLTFTAIDSSFNIRLDSIKVMNRTQNCDTMLYWNDTVLVLDYYVGYREWNKKSENLIINCYPNPVNKQSRILVKTPEAGELRLLISDVSGRKLCDFVTNSQGGTHSFIFVPGDGAVFFLTVSCNKISKTVKILSSSSSGGSHCAISYTGSNTNVTHTSSFKDTQRFEYNLGDDLLYIGHHDTLQSGMLDAPMNSKTYTFQFATNIPCPGTPTVEYEGQIYNTIQVFSQCWLQKNLNVGTMINGDQEQTNNGIIEKYCVVNLPERCDNHGLGGLYQWDEMMQYTNESGTQGICPPGWHIPTDEEWKILLGAADTQYGIGDDIWDILGNNGHDAGKNLKRDGGWQGPNNGTNIFGFSACAAGLRTSIGDFFMSQFGGYWWTSNENDIYSAYNHSFLYNTNQAIRSYLNRESGISVRCIKNSDP